MNNLDLEAIKEAIDSFKKDFVIAGKTLNEIERSIDELLLEHVPGMDCGKVYESEYNYIMTIVSGYMKEVKEAIGSDLYISKKDGNIILSNSLLAFIDRKTTKKQIELSIKDNGYLLEDGQKVGIFDFLEIIKNNYGDIGLNLSMLASGIFQDYTISATNESAHEDHSINSIEKIKAAISKISSELYSINEYILNQDMSPQESDIVEMLDFAFDNAVRDFFHK